MKLIFQLSKQNLELSRDEVLAIFPGKYKLIDNLLILNSKEKYFDRLAYTKSVYQFLFACKKNQLKNKIKSFKWNKYYKKDFCVRAHGMDSSFVRELTSLVWNRVKDPQVNLSNPKTRFYFIPTRDYIVCGLLIKELAERFEDRKAHLMPGSYYAAMHPRLARCMVNLTGIKQGVLVDPFCGAGGLLVEAGLIGLKVIGSDIDERVLKKAEHNLKHFKINYVLQKANAVKLSKKMDYVAADLPYSISTKGVDLEKLYSDFLSNLKRILRKRAVICFPNFINHQKLIKDAKLKLKQEFIYYIHKSLSKIVCVIEP